MKSIIGCAVAGAVLWGAASATPVVDQEQTAFGAPDLTWAIGGSETSRQMLAQTFRVGRTGSLTQMNLPIGCRSGELIIEIRRQSGGLPSGVLLATSRHESSEFSDETPRSFVPILLDTPVSVRTGQELAFVLANPTGECGTARASAGDSYMRGVAYFDARPEPPGWRRLAVPGLDAPDDLVFQTVVDVPGGGGGTSAGCLIPAPGGGPSHFAADLPVCRCLRDASLREFRCALLHPDFFAIRRIPWPMPPPGSPFEETWEFYPIAPLDGPVRMRLSGGGLSQDVVREFGRKTQLSAKAKVPLAAETERFVVKGVVPGQLTQGAAWFDYPMTDAASDVEREFGMDRTLTTEPFEK